MQPHPVLTSLMASSKAGPLRTVVRPLPQTGLRTVCLPEGWSLNTGVVGDGTAGAKEV